LGGVKMHAKMHKDEVLTDVALVRRLLATQFPQWAELPIAPVASAGTDNALYRLGDDLCARLPRIHWAVGQAPKELRWLPQLVPHLPVAIPSPVVLGTPGEGYPWSWAVYRWLEGSPAHPDDVAGSTQIAQDLARFITALHGIDASNGPPLGEQSRGGPLVLRDASTRAAIAQLGTRIDAAAVGAAWDAARAAPVWDRPPVWIHADLSPGNLLLRNGRLSAVLDFGCLAVGDPACDLIVAWSTFDAPTRAHFRAALDVDDATWARGRGWALSIALIALPYYWDTNPVLVAAAWRAIGAVLAEVEAN
jgi:aminoglycoside phosphotransferase (APT) family kinase protein